VWNSVVEDILGKDRVESVRLKNVQTGEVTMFPTDAVFVAIGHKPSTDVFKGQLDLDENGYVKVQEETKTSVEGVFAAGDARDPKYKQAITSAGSGCNAALDTQKYLQEHPI
jgi:thioredoxin reductase (NADPH)